MTDTNNEQLNPLNYYPTKVRNGERYLLRRPTIAPFDICALHELCRTTKEEMMEYHLEHINYPLVESGIYPSHYTRDLGYHVIAFNTPFGKKARTQVRYRLYLLYLDESGDLRNHVCTPCFLSGTEMLKHLDALQATITESTL